VGGEVAPARRLLHAHRRIASDDEAAMATPALRFTAGERHVDVAALEDLEALADRLDATEPLEEHAQIVGCDAEDLDVDILRVAAEESIAHPSAHHQRAPASVSDGSGDVEGPGINHGQHWNAGMQECRNAGTQECRNAGMEACIGQISIGLRPHRLVSQSLNPGATAPRNASPLPSR
jgi:hypothetical protein